MKISGIELRQVEPRATIERDPRACPHVRKRRYHHLVARRGEPRGLFPDIESDEVVTVPFEEIDYRENTLVYGVTALPVTWDRPI